MTATSPASAAPALTFQGAVAGDGWTSINTGGGAFLGVCGPGQAGGACNFSGLQDGIPDTDVANSTPWRYETVAISGVEYWHMVIGTDPGTGNGFAQDVYIRSGTHWINYMDGGVSQVDVVDNENPGDGGSYSHSGGFTSGMIGQNGAGNADVFVGSPITCEVYAGNGCDPLGLSAGHDATWTGNGSGNPTMVAIRQINRDAEMTQEYLKDLESKKPRVTQITSQAGANGFTSSFQADMRGIDYNTMNTSLSLGSTMIAIGAPPYPAASGIFVNKMVFNSATANDGNFDHATDREAGKSTVTAGRYTWTSGDVSGYGWVNNTCSNWTTSPGTCTQPTYYGTYYSGTADIGDFTPVPLYKAGTYTYFDGTMNPAAISYKDFMNAAENPFGGKPFQ